MTQNYETLNKKKEELVEKWKEENEKGQKRKEAIEKWKALSVKEKRKEAIEKWNALSVKEKRIVIGVIIVVFSALIFTGDNKQNGSTLACMGLHGAESRVCQSMNDAKLYNNAHDAGK